jgi:hypothetical protein
MSAQKNKVRDWYVNQALESVVRLNEILSELTEDEVIAALRLESQSRRRRSIVDRLISRAVRLRELTYVNYLKEHYSYATSPVKDSVRRRKESRQDGSPG